MNRKWRQLATERIENTHPSIPLRRNFWALSLDESKEIAELFQHKETKELVTCLHDRSKHDKVEVLDAAYWVKGCSSLGHLRCAVLLGVGKSFCLIDLKEAVRPAAPGYKSSGIPRNHAEREVEAARQLSPFLGEPDARREV